MEHHRFSSLGLLRFGGPTRQKTRQEIGDPQRGPSMIHANLKVLAKTARLKTKGPRRSCTESLSRDMPGQYLDTSTGAVPAYPGTGLSRHVPAVPAYPGTSCPRISSRQLSRQMSRHTAGRAGTSRDKPVPGYAGTPRDKPVCMYVCMYAWQGVYVCMFACMYVCMFVYVYTCYVCMCVCKDVSMCASNMYLPQTHINAEAMPRNRMERERTLVTGNDGPWSITNLLP